MQEKGYTEDSEALFDRFYTTSKKSREDYNKDIVLLAENGVKDQAKAIEDNAPQVEDATQTMMDNSFSKACDAIGMPTTGGTSTKYSTLGHDIIDSIVEGFNGGDSTIGNALGSILQNAADSVNVSGIAAKINSQLATELNREMGR